MQPSSVHGPMISVHLMRQMVHLILLAMTLLFAHYEYCRLPYTLPLGSMIVGVSGLENTYRRRAFKETQRDSIEALCTPKPGEYHVFSRVILLSVRNNLRSCSIIGNVTSVG